MDTPRKILIFEHIVHKLRDWFMENKEMSTIEEFNVENDFSILKVVKLHFLVITINSGQNSNLLEEHEFYAMPYGPVETDIYNRIRTKIPFDNFRINNFKTIFSNYGTAPLIEEEFSTYIEESINKIRHVSPNIIFADASTLVELTHKWSSWISTYKMARSHNSYSRKIDSNLIKTDNKLLNTNLVY